MFDFLDIVIQNRKLKAFGYLFSLAVCVYIGIVSRDNPDVRYAISPLVGILMLVITGEFFADDREEDRDIVGTIKSLLTDFRFSSFILNDAVSFLYRICCFAFWSALYIFGMTPFDSAIPIVAIVFLLFVARIFLELTVSITKIAENTSRN